VEILDFAASQDWESWLAQQHTAAAEAWLRIGRRGAKEKRLLILTLLKTRTPDGRKRTVERTIERLKG
jgi:hypothetical protein